MAACWECVSVWLGSGICVYVKCVFLHGCIALCMYAYLALHLHSRRVYTVRAPVCAWLCLARACVCMYSGCLGAWRAGGALQGGLREASGEGSDAGVCQGGGREQLIPAADCGRQVQVLQEDLGHSHEALVVHTPIIPPHYYLEKKWQQFFFLLLSSAVETSQLLEDPKSIFHTTNLLTQ